MAAAAFREDIDRAATVPELDAIRANIDESYGPVETPVREEVARAGPRGWGEPRGEREPAQARRSGTLGLARAGGAGGKPEEREKPKEPAERRPTSNPPPHSFGAGGL